MSDIEHSQTAKALIEARDALHALCLERGSTDGYGAVFGKINAALLADRGAVEAISDATQVITDALSALEPPAARSLIRSSSYQAFLAYSKRGR